MKKGLKFTKEQLGDLYYNKKLSLIQIGKKFDCNGSNIHYWLSKFDIKRRPAYFKKIDIPKGTLKNLYWNKNWTTQQIADKFGIKYGRSILKKLKKFGILSKTISQAITKKFKTDFLEDPKEKAYFLGLRAGDFHVKWARKSIRVQTTTTHTAQIDLLRNAFSKYGEICKYYSKNKAREDEWFIYTDLNQSFKFLLEKPEEIPSWILGDNSNFYHFLAAYMDCEGSLRVAKSHEKHVRFFFDISTGDKKIIEQIKEKLNSLDYNAYSYLDKKKGDAASFGPYKKDIYNVVINRKNDIIRLIQNLLPLSKHSEKIRKMKFMLENKDKKWNEIEEGWNKLREEIKGELLKNGQS